MGREGVDKVIKCSIMYLGGKTMSSQLKSMRFDKEIIKKVEELAKEENRSFSNMVQTILKEYFKKAGR